MRRSSGSLKSLGLLFIYLIHFISYIAFGYVFVVTLVLCLQRQCFYVAPAAVVFENNYEPLLCTNNACPSSVTMETYNCK